MKKNFLVLPALLFCLFCLPLCAAGAEGDVISENVTIGDVDVSGMRKEDAKKAVDAYLETLGEATITLQGPEKDEVVEIKAKDLAFTIENEAVFDEALSLGKTGNVVTRYKERKLLSKEGVVLPLTLDYKSSVIEDAVRKECSAFNKEAKNFSLKRSGASFTVTDGADGYAIDEAASIAAVEKAILSDADGKDVTVALIGKVTKPKGSKEELSKVKDVLGTFTTGYASSGASRSKNIANGCSLINGHTVYPGEEFSTLDAITPFTAANGYELAGSYLNGEVVESFGGGICQVSTTLYNACLLSELTIVRRENHSMIVTYVKPSQDAAISESGGKDFVFKNNTDAPVYIEGATAGKSITFTIYGHETRKASRKVSFESETLETIPATSVKYVKDPAQPVGYVKTTQSEHTGYKARLWKVVTEDGKQVSRDVINNSYYMPSGKIVTVGTGGTSDPNVLAQIDAAIASGNLDAVKAAAGQAPAVAVSADIQAKALADAAAAGVTDPETIAAYAQALAEQQAQQAAAAAAAAQAAAAAAQPEGAAP